jgi:drug/metabolite transporter (DMT)-like permease
MWLILGILGSIAFAIVGVMDKFILSEEVSKPVVYTFYSTIIGLIVFLLIPFGGGWPHSLWEFFVFLSSGMLFGFGLWAMYVSFETSEVSHAGPLIGAATAFFVAILSRIFLGEHLSWYQIIAVVLLIAGSLIISFEVSARHKGIHIGMLWAVISGLCLAGSHVFAKYAYDIFGFFHGFVWTRGTMGFLGLLLLLSPAVIAALTVKKKKTVKVKKHPLTVVISDKLIGIVGLVTIQYAAAIGSVSMVQALGGVQYGLLVIMVALLSKFKPSLFKETYTQAEKIQETAAIIIIVAGLAMMVF